MRQESPGAGQALVCAVAGLVADPSPPRSLVPPEWRQGLGESRWVSASQELQAPAWPEWAVRQPARGGVGTALGSLLRRWGEEGHTNGSLLPTSHYRFLCGPLSRVQAWLGCRHQYVLTTCLWGPSGHSVGVLRG